MLSKNQSDHEYDYNTHWISKQCNTPPLGLSLGPLVTGALKFGLIWDIVYLTYVVTQWEHIGLPFLGSWGLVLLWVNIAPYLIWNYDEVVLPQFFDKFRDICEDTDELDDIARYYNNFFGEPNLLLSALWAVAILVVALVGTPVLQNQGMSGEGSIFLWLTYAYAIYMGAVLAGPGFGGPITTLLLVRRSADLEFKIQPLHPDQLGGLSTVGYLSIRTTLLFSSASLFLPLSFRLSAGTRIGDVILGIVAVYILTIVATFVYPTYKINRKAASIRDDILEELKTEYTEASQKTEGWENGGINEVNRQLELQRIRTTYDDYNNVRLYPLQIDILIQLAGSILLPLFFLFIETYVQNSIL